MELMTRRCKWGVEIVYRFGGRSESGNRYPEIVVSMLSPGRERSGGRDIEHGKDMK